MKYSGPGGVTGIIGIFKTIELTLTLTLTLTYCVSLAWGERSASSNFTGWVTPTRSDPREIPPPVKSPAIFGVSTMVSASNFDPLQRCQQAARGLKEAGRGPDSSPRMPYRPPDDANSFGALATLGDEQAKEPIGRNKWRGPPGGHVWVSNSVVISRAGSSCPEDAVG